MRSLRSALPTIATILAAFGVFLLVFQPVFSVFGTHFLGYEDVDAYGTHWFYWFVSGALSRFEGIGHTNLFFYPFGKDIYAHTGANVLDAVVAWPFLSALGPTAGYNLFCLFALVINGAAARPLLGLFTENRAARVVGATLYALNPFLLSELIEGRPTQVFQPFLPLFFYHLLRFEEAGWRHAVLAAVHLALTALTYWFYAIFAGMVAVVHFLQRTILHPEPRRFFVRHAAAGLLSLVMVIPAALPLIQSTVDGNTPGLLDQPEWPFTELKTTTGEGVDVALYQFQPLLRANGFFIHKPDGSTFFNPRALVLTWTQVALVALGVALSRHRWVLGAMLGAALLIAVGHVIWLGGPSLPNPIYVLGVRIIPFMRRLWWPGRAMVLVSLLAGVLAAAGLGEVARRYSARLALLLGLISLGSFGYELQRLEYAPFPTWDSHIPDGYRCLAEGPPGAVIELPYARTQAHLYYQTAHGRPILGGMIEDNPIFTPAEQRKLARENSFLSTLLAVSNDARAEGEPTDEDKQALRDLGYRYVVVQLAGYVKTMPSSRVVDVFLGEQTAALNRRLQALIGAPVYADPDINIYAPWGDPSPCGHAGRGRLAGEMHRPEERPDPPDGVQLTGPREEAAAEENRPDPKKI